jgi:hypothetical protein
MIADNRLAASIDQTGRHKNGDDELHKDLNSLF